MAEHAQHEYPKVGDPVKVFDVNGDRHGQPADGWDGNVVKAGSKLVTITYSHGYTTVFRLEDGRVNDKYGHQHFLTLPQAERGRRRKTARDTLRAHHVTLEPKCSLPLETLEDLAAVLASYERRKQED